MVVYVIYTHKCNLSCPHCTIKNIKENFDEEKFWSTYKNINSEIIIFGGEPFLDKKKLKKLLDLNNNVSTISSNMILWDKDIENILADYPKVGIGSSWNPRRFTESQYNLWLKNLHDSNRVGNINITLTEDLFSYDFNQLIKILNDINEVKSINTVCFEPLVPDYNPKKGDEFLCRIYDVFKTLRIKIDLLKLFSRKYCGSTKTLLPSGDLINDCPQSDIRNLDTFKECFNCPYYKICKPCRKLSTCWFPKNFYELIKFSPEYIQTIGVKV